MRRPRPDLSVTDPDFIVGLDLGQASDYTALSILERSWQCIPDEPHMEESQLALRHLKRWPLKTPYPQIVADVAELVKKPPLKKPILVVDETGVGRAVVDQFREVHLSAKLTPVVITGGNTTHYADGAWRVPKKELVSSVQMVLQARRLQVARLPERELLIKELLAFRVKITAAANETFEAWRNRDHDDLVLSAALACWWAETQPPAQSRWTPVTLGLR